MSLSVCSVNVRGIRQFEKRRDVFHYLKGLSCALYCLVDTHLTPEMAGRVRSEWGADVWLSCGSDHARGVAVLPRPGAPVVIHNQMMDSAGNYIILDVEFDGYFRCVFVVLYGPNDDRPKFFLDIFEKAAQLGTKELPTIFVGDWNFVLDPDKDTKFYRTVGNPRARRTVMEAIENENLVDIWREQHPNLRKYTWRRVKPAKYSRLDFFLISAELVCSIHASDIVWGYRTDHNIIKLTFKNQDRMKRSLFWKFNNSLLEDSAYLELIRREIKCVKDQYRLPVSSADAIDDDQHIRFSIDDQLFFETLLCHLRGVTIEYASRIKRGLVIRERELVEKIQRLESNTSQELQIIERIEALKSELCTLRKRRMEGILVRAKARWIELGERPSRYFCGLEKRQYTQKYIGSLEINGDDCNDQAAIMNYLQELFQDIYRPTKRSKELKDIAVLLRNGAVKLSPEEQRELEGVISFEEANVVVAKLHSDKSPGPDGFTANFFKAFWKDLDFPDSITELGLQSRPAVR